MRAKISKINVRGTEIVISEVNGKDYMSLTDMTKSFEGGSKLIEKWINNKSTIEFLGIWEKLNNEHFNSPEFGGIKNETGSNKFYISISKFISKTNAIGIMSKTGRYGGTHAHADIAYHFGMWLSPEFHLLVIKELQRLKEIESNQYNLEWNIRRILSKTNYAIHTGAIKKYIIPNIGISEKKEWIYASEADMFNIIMFGCTSKQWRKANPQRVLEGENIRDMASINELAILSNLESLNSILVKKGFDMKTRGKILHEASQEQKQVLEKFDPIKSLKKQSATSYIDANDKKSV